MSTSTTTTTEALPKNRCRLRRLAVAAIVLLSVATASASGVFGTANDWLTASRAQLLPAERGGDAVIVAVDTASLQQDRDWPWSRAKHARLIETLDQAGASAIAFDFDFSSRGEGDAAFARAAQAAEARIYTAVFRREYDQMPGVYAEMLPTSVIAPFVEPVSTTFVADADGIVRSYEDSVAFSFGRVPSMAFALAELPPQSERVTLSLAGRPGHVPTYSFGDVLNGLVDPAAFEGKTVLVGATAIELGDEFAIPAYGLQSGVLLNALSYEAAARGDFPNVLAWPWALVLALGPLAAALIGWPEGRDEALRYGARNALAVGATIGVGIGAERLAGISIPTAEIYTAHGLALVGAGLLSIDWFASRDFRSRMALQTTATMMEALIETNHEGVLIVDRSGTITRANERAGALSAKSDRPLAGTALSAAFPEIAALGLEAKDGAAQVDCATGASIDVHWSRIETARSESLYERRAEDRASTILLLHDVTPLVQAEAAERAARQEHEEASAAKSALMMTMSHELRTPLNAIIGFSDLIRDEAFGDHAASEYGEFAGMASKSGRRLLRVVDDLLRAARFQAGRAELDARRVALTEVAANAVEALREQDDGFALEPELALGGISATVDPAMIELALRHLLENASKFAGKEASVRIAASADGDDLVLSVRDDGPGLPGDTDTDALTSLFKQADSSLSRTSEGCGLGLFLVRSVATTHGGDLAIEGADGFTATLRLPGRVASRDGTEASTLPDAA